MSALPPLTRRHWVAGGLALAGASALPGWAQSGARTLRIGYQKGWLSLLKARGTLEQKLQSLGVKVSWTEFNAGPVQLEALNVGAIDFGDVGEAPPIFAQAAGAPLVYAAATVPRPGLEAVLVPDHSPLRVVSDLKGRKVAFNKGSNVQYFLVKLLEKHGLKYSDVRPIFLSPPDARAAFERGDVDAWVIWDPFLASAQKTLGARVLANAEGVAHNRAYYFTSSDFAQNHADIVRLAVGEIAAIDLWVRDHQPQAASELAQVLGLPQPVTELFLSRVGYGTVPITPDILAEQQAIADTFLDLRLIPKKLQLAGLTPFRLS
jgi:sulfonate transport system substrate-binding protein